MHFWVRGTLVSKRLSYEDHWGLDDKPTVEMPLQGPCPSSGGSQKSRQ